MPYPCLPYLAEAIIRPPNMDWNQIFAGVKFIVLCALEKIHRSITLETKPASRTPLLIWLVASQLLALLSLVFWLFAAGLSTMAPASGMSQAARNIALLVWAYPIWPIAFTVAAWIAYTRKKDKLAAVLTTLTFLPVLILILTIVLSGAFGPVGL